LESLKVGYSYQHTYCNKEQQFGSKECARHDRQVSPEGVPPLVAGGREGGRKLSVLLISSMFIGHQLSLIALGKELVRSVGEYVGGPGMEAEVQSH